MKKMRLVSIVLGVFLILAGMMSGVTLAQVSEESAQNIQTITFEEFLKSPESFVGKGVELTEGTVFTMRKTGPIDGSYGAYLTVTPEKVAFSEELEFGHIGGPFTIIYLSSSLFSIDEGKEVVKPRDIVTVKGMVKVITIQELEERRRKFFAGEIELTLNRMVETKVYEIFFNTLRLIDQPDSVKSVEKVYWIEVSDIKKTGYVSYSPEQKAQEKTTGIPDYENFPFKWQESCNKDKDGRPGLMIYQYIREIEREELKDEQKLTITFYDSIAIFGRPSFGGEETLAWIPSGKIYFSIDKVTGALKNEGEDYDYKDIRYAIKENGKWKFVDEQTHDAKTGEILESVNPTYTPTKK